MEGKIAMKTPLLFTVLLTLVSGIAPAQAQDTIQPGTVPAHWYEGAADCKSAPLAPPLQVQAYNDQTLILRESLCSTFEAPFMYLLIGTDQALLIDTGDVADPAQMPLAKSVLQLLPHHGAARLPLLVVHSHRHLDHRAADPQFQNLPDVQVVPFDLDGLRAFYKFNNWPEGQASIDLGGRILDVIPAPGHNPTELAFYDRNTALLFSGDFLLPGRLLVDDIDAYQASARRVAAFVKDRPVSAVLGGHIEKDTKGELFDWESQYHPGEGSLALGKDDLLALPAALASFNGFYSSSGRFTIMNPNRNLLLMAVAALLVIGALLTLLVRWLRRRRKGRRQQVVVPA
jgi:hydroxyacylglutathione hydrolase